MFLMTAPSFIWMPMPDLPPATTLMFDQATLVKSPQVSEPICSAVQPLPSVESRTVMLSLTMALVLTGDGRGVGLGGVGAGAAQSGAVEGQLHVAHHVDGADGVGAGREAHRAAAHAAAHGDGGVDGGGVGARADRAHAIGEG